MKIDNRRAFVGAHVTAPVKKALISESKKKGMSLSAYIFKLLLTQMRRKRYKVDA